MSRHSFGDRDSLVDERVEIWAQVDSLLTESRLKKNVIKNLNNLKAINNIYHATTKSKILTEA